MHVGAVLAGFDPQSGGGFTYEDELLKALVANAHETRHKFTVFSSSGVSKALEREVAGSPVGLVEVPVRRQRLVSMLLREFEIARAHWRWQSELDKVARQNDVHFIWFLSAQPQRTDLPYMTVVWDLHHRLTPWFPEVSAKGQWDSREAAYRPFLQRASAIIAGTEAGRKQICSFYRVHEQNVLVLPYPTPSFVNDTMEPVDLEKRFGLRKPFVLYPAQFWPHKNHVNLILAVSILRRQGLEMALALPGSDKGNRKFIEELAGKEGVSDLVNPLGFVSRSELIALYRQSVCLAYVSWFGPDNLPPLEAFALGCPVVAGQIPGAEEQLGEAALFCDPADPASIAAAIATVARDPTRRAELVKAGKTRSTYFTPNDYVRGVFQFLDRFEPLRRCWP